jgi:hypothetical protein
MKKRISRLRLETETLRPLRADAARVDGGYLISLACTHVLTLWVNQCTSGTTGGSGGPTGA